MTSSSPHDYEQLTPDQAARIDAVCDAFEQAWKAAQAGGAVPQIADFLDQSPESERTVLHRELMALDQACRERYNLLVRPQGGDERLAAERDGLGFVDTRLGLPDGSLTPRAVHPTSLPDAETAEFAPGTLVAHYQIVEYLGGGGMGVVYKA